MEVHVIDTLSGREEPLEIDADATVSAMKRQCGEAFGFGEDVELSVSGQRVACDGAERISNVAAFSGGCRVGVVRGVAEFVAQLRSGAVTMDDIPVWARQRRECVLAMLADGSITIEPHWVHPSLHDDKEVMLRFVECDPKAFLRASAALRSDADFVIAALQRDASMWYHVEDKSLQEQRSVALLAVPHCANSAVWLSDKAFVLEAVDTDLSRAQLVWPYVSKALQQDREVARTALDYRNAVKVHFGALSETLRGDKDFVMKVFHKVDHFCDLSEALKQDKEVVMKAIHHGKLGVFHQLSATLQQDKEIAITALDHSNVNFNDLSDTLREDKDFVMKALKSSVTNSHQLSATLREDKEVILESLGSSSLSLKFSDLSEALQQDKDVVMKALKCNKLEDFHLLSATLQQDKEVVKESLHQGIVRFGALSEALRGDKEVAMVGLASKVSVIIDDLSEALREDEEVRLACKRLKEEQEIATRHQDKEVAMKALCEGTVSFCDLSEELRGDKEFIMDLRHEAGCNAALDLGDLSETLRGDKEFIMQVLEGVRVTGFHRLSLALKQDEEVVIVALRGHHLRFGDLSETLRGDKEFVMAALTWAGYGDFYKLSPTLQQDKEVLMRHFKTVGEFLQLSATLQQDKEVVMAFEAGESDDTPTMLDFSDLSEAMRGDKEVVMKALYYGKVLYFHDISAVLQNDKEVVMEAHGDTYLGLEWLDLSEALRSDKAFVMRSLQTNLAEYVYMTGPLRHDKDVALAAIAGGSLFADTISNFMRMAPALCDDLDVALAAIRADPCNFIYAGDSVRADKQAALAAFDHADYNPPVLLPFASAELQADREVVLAAVRANAKNGEYASPALQDLAASGP